MRFVYTLLFYLLLPGIILRLWGKSIKIPAYRKRIAERFGFVPILSQPDNLWLHAVSLGESIAATPLIKALLARYPQRKLIITNMTPTGSSYIAKTFGDQVINTYVPYDIPLALDRFLNRIKPSLVIMMETELWPNTFARCAKRNLPIIIANARLSERSAKGYAKIAPLVRTMLQQVAIVAAQTKADAERFIALGLDDSKAKVLGNIKFDLQLPEDLADQAKDLRADWGARRPIWIAASTHDGEHELVLQAFTELRRMIPDCLLILVPRHPERFKFVADLCSKEYSVSLRSQHTRLSADTAIVIGDTMGELKLLYAAADIAFVGGSLVPVGGHNLLEPAAVGLPSLTGPYMHNFVEINALLQQAGVVKTVHNASELANAVCLLLKNETERTHLGATAKQLVAQNRGAVLKHLEIIDKL